MKKHKVGFLYLGPISHIYHSISIALHLSTNNNYEVTLFVSAEPNLEIVTNIINKFKSHNCNIEYLRPTLFHKLIRIFKKRPHPRVRNILEKNRKKLSEFKALILTDRHFLNKTPIKPRYILTGHGAGDRVRGFTEAMKKFDYILVSGNEKWRRMEELNYITQSRGKIIGYPKFDIALLNSNTITPFKDTKPIVLYNPHFNETETSWYSWGKKILDYFLENKDYNLIFAPHLILFSKKKDNIDKKYYQSENIHIDLESGALIDMTYTKMADIYLGDVSSQVYEFVGLKKRPCLFLNAHNVEWKNNSAFRMWEMGDVIENLNFLEIILKKSQESFLAYSSIQSKLIEDTFSIADQSAGQRGAIAIDNFLNK